MKSESVLLKIWKVMYPVGIYFLLSNIISVVYVMISAVLLQAKTIANGESLDALALQEELTSLIYKNSMMLTAIAATIMIPIAWLIFRSDRKKEKIRYEKCNMGLFGLILIVAAVACMGGNQLLSISRLDVLFPGFNEVQEALYGGNIYMEVLAAVILAPIVEELLFRGLVYRRIRNYAGRMPAMILSSLFFGIYHGNVVQGVYAFLVGMLFAFIYDKYKTLTAPILAHVFANLISVLSVETGIFNFMYTNDLNFYISTVVEVVSCIILIVLINKKVTRKEMIEELVEEKYISETTQKGQEY